MNSFKVDLSKFKKFSEEDQRGVLKKVFDMLDKEGVAKDINDFQPHQVNKKKAVYARHKGMKKQNIPTLSTNGLRIKELYDLNSKEFNLNEEEGISSRVNKI